MAKLPIDDLLPQIVSELETSNNVVIQAAPGAGKTTRVPPALLNRGDVLVLEPRRLAARMAARRVAQELGEKPGETIGYQVRFEDISSPRTRLKFLTEGVLTRRLLSDPQLRGASTVILDEFHERHLESDLALALLRRLQKSSRPDFAVGSDVRDTRRSTSCALFEQLSRLHTEVAAHPLEIAYTPHSSTPLEEQVAAAVEKFIGKGDILVFLPGAAEIRRASRALESLAARANLLVLPLHGDLSSAEQDRAVSSADRPKVILSTNVAESSVTIPGVNAVVDSGLARIASDSPWTGLPSVEVKRISQASAKQRAGRAARTGPGRVIRLYTEQEYHRLAPVDIPEILRGELSQTVLFLRSIGARDLDWLDAPPHASWNAAGTLLDKLAVTPDMADLPLPPRLAKLVVETKRRGAPTKGCAAAAVLSAGERGSSDLLALIEGNWQPQTQRVYDQLIRQVGGRDRRDAGDTELLLSLLAAFPDRVARHRRDGELLLSSGGSANFPGCRSEFLIAIDMEHRREHGLPIVRLAAPIEPEWLLERSTERIRLEWNRTAERVEQASALLYDQLVIEETRAPAESSEEAGELLAQKALEAGIARFVDADALAQLTMRSALAGIVVDAEAELRKLCRHMTSFAELTDANLLEHLRPSRLDHAAPAQIKLSGGRQVKVHYDAGKPPWIESRLQDFFGMHETPKINGTAVVVHLLAPNHRPVQVTTDLKGFWERLYPQVRKELMRRYPRHKWPEKPE